MIRLRGRAQSAPRPLDLELEVGDEGSVRLDHYCPGAGLHRLLGIALTEAERARLRGGGRVDVAVSCDRCIWQRRLILRLRP